MGAPRIIPTGVLSGTKGDKGERGPSGGPFPDISGVDEGKVAVTDGTGGVEFQPAALLAISGQTPSEAPVPPGTAAVGTLPIAARADHVHPALGIFMVWGPGTDGDAVFDGSSTVAGWSRSGSVYTATGVLPKMMFHNVTIDAGVTVVLGQFPIFCSGTLTNNGTIKNDGGNASGATQGSVQSVSNSYFQIAGLGANGGTGAGAAGQVTRTATNANPVATQGYGGSGGAGGNASGGGTAGGAQATQNGASILANAGGLTSLIRSPHFAFSGLMPPNGATGLVPFFGGNGGSAGAGDGTNAGGAGGGGGTAILINARNLVNNGTISSKGGNGGAAAGGNAGGGGGGGGGPIVINTTSLTGSGTVLASGGAGGAKAGTGVAGSAGGAGYIQTTVWA